MNKYHGIYTGIVISNSGREQEREIPSGYVLVKIDGITPTRFSETYRAVPASNTSGSLDEDFARSVEVLARVLSPIFGESTMAKYNATTNTNSITHVTTIPDKFDSNELIPPSGTFFPFSKHTRSKSSDQHKNVIAKNNTYGHSFFPDHRYRAGSGVFAVPERNTRVLVMFLNGNRSAPVVIGKVNDTQEVEGFYNKGGVRPGYPGPFQNQSRDML
jgi:hypothetical protein